MRESFEKYGEILSIIAHKNLKMRGQAFIAFDSKVSAEKALENLNGSRIIDTIVDLQYAKSESDSHLQNVLDLESFNKHKSHRQGRKAQRQSKKRSLEDAEPQPAKKIKLVENDEPNKLLLLQQLSPSIAQQDLQDFFDDFEGLVNVRLVAIRNLAFVEFEDEKYSAKCKDILSEGKPKSLQQITIKGEKCYLTFAKK